MFGVGGSLAPQPVGERPGERNSQPTVSEAVVTRRPDPFIQALASLMGRAETGVYAPGQPVVIVDEARRLKLSTTPVREALAWLCGYGLVERAPAGGFLAPRLEPAVVVDRLAFRLHCLSVSVNGAGQAHGGGGRPSEDPVEALSGHMLRTVRATGNAALADAYGRVASQLRQLAEAERRVFDDLEDEARALVDLFAAPGGGGLPEALGVYHRRRMDAAAVLVLEAEAGRAEASDVGEAAP
jgi:hypothetical protein